MQDPSTERAAHKHLLLRLGWLFPLTYLFHILEEWVGGFVAWFARVLGVGLTEGAFLWLNAAALAGMTLGVALAYRFGALRWLFVSFGTVTLVNAAAHVAASLATLSYSPGVLSGALLWLPLGFVTVRAGRGALKRRPFAAGVLVGALMHAAVTLLAVFG
ncbi:MAG: HXXEE domain-containing protein [Acidobacteria bacterium]|nr:HXXEE domain-containing protein [Acidobacteriota bacterium]